MIGNRIVGAFALGAVAFAGGISDATQPQSDAPPAWAYVLNPGGRPKAAPDDGKLLHVPGSAAAFTATQVSDRFDPADWRPRSHPSAPAIVAHGRKPDVWACGYCHYPNGQGRPENASLAGQPLDYLVEQVTEMREGRRKSSGRGIPPATMLGIAQHVTLEELRVAAAYFSRLPYRPWIRVVESARVPKTRVAGVGMLGPIEGGDMEPLGNRIIEVPENLPRTELRDSASGFVAYVPLGSIERGKALVASGAGAAPCASCHGAGLKGMGSTPALAGRSPSYLVRQLYDIAYGARRGPAVATMQAEVAHVSPSDRIAIAAYMASLKP